MRALISTIRPACGGVAAKVEWVIAELEALGITPVLAWYEPWSCSPELSVPFGALLQGRQPGQHQEASLGGHRGHDAGLQSLLRHRHRRRCYRRRHTRRRLNGRHQNHFDRGMVHDNRRSSHHQNRLFCPGPCQHACDQNP